MNKLFNTHILSFFAAMLLIFNIATIALADEKTPKESKPEAIIALVVGGAVLPTAGAVFLGGMEFDAAELAPIFALAAEGATLGEIASAVGSLLVISAGIAAIFAVAA